MQVCSLGSTAFYLYLLLFFSSQIKRPTAWEGVIRSAGIAGGYCSVAGPSHKCWEGTEAFALAFTRDPHS